MFAPSLTVTHASVLGTQASDSAIWEYAKCNDLVIVTKDADFSERIAATNPPPRVVHLLFGNKRKREYQELLAKVWPRIEHAVRSHKIVRVHEGGLITGG